MNKNGKKSETLLPGVVKEYSALLGRATEELAIKVWKTGVAKYQSKEIEALETAGWCEDHYGLLMKTVEFFKRHPDLVPELRSIPIPSRPPRKVPIELPNEGRVMQRGVKL